MKCLAILLCATALFSTRPVAAQGPTATSPFAGWKMGPPRDPSFFPLAIWLQQPRNAPRFQAAGINLYVALWQGPTEEQLKELKAAGMPVICAQNDVGLAHKDDPIIVGWMHGDEPDNAQPVTDPQTGKRTWGPPVPPAKVVADYERIRAADPTRPVLLNLGQGVANDEWKGRGPGSHPDDYLTYVKAADILSFDVYPVAGIRKTDGENYLWYVPKGVDRLHRWSEGKKLVWNCIETSRIDGERRPTPHQVRAEVWMALIHGSTGIVYFVHEFKPKFNEHALLDDPEMLAAVTKINDEIRGLAPVLNSPSITGMTTARSSDPETPIDAMTKRAGDAVYVFAVGMRNRATRGSFSVGGLPAEATVEVLGENRKIAARDGRFEDDFAPHDVHLYRIAPVPGNR